MKPVTPDHVEFVAYVLAKKLMNWDEPIPDFTSRYPGRLESCLASPFQTFAGESPYKTLAEKGAAMFYFMIKSHPFENGNKRLAVTTLLVFLALNEKWIHVTALELYAIAKDVAKSYRSDKDIIIMAVSKFIDRAMLSYSAEA